ncbi:MAG: R3H domain-containing nucleic acid-binding protein [Cyanobacteria bacterium P01_H01_bin.74]
MMKKTSALNQLYLQPVNALSLNKSSEPIIDSLFNQQEESPISTDLQSLIDVLPAEIQAALMRMPLDDLIEIILDLGRPAEARFAARLSESNIVALSQAQITQDEINHVVQFMGAFTSDNRAGIPRTLHRISAMRNRQGEVVGLTCRVGKVVTGTVDPIKDIIESGKSVLLLGRPGVGKTSRLREVARLMANEANKRVVIVDTSNEIAGDGDIPHPAVGRARRIQVPMRERQRETMIEAVQNHTPEVIIVDEIGTEEEALASRTIAERGVILIATAHGHSLENLIKNPMLSDLVGGIETVTLGDEEARRRSSQKTVLERSQKPTFDICIEIRDRHTLAVYPDVAEAVDHLLRGWTLFPEIRKTDTETGATRVLKTKFEPDIHEGLLEQNPLQSMVGNPMMKAHVRDGAPIPAGQQEYRLYLYGVSKAYIDQILERLGLHHVRISKNVYDANAIIALKSSIRPGSKMMQLAEDYEVPVFYTKANTMPQIQRALREAMNADVGAFADQFSRQAEHSEDELTLAMKEVEAAVKNIQETQQAQELSPRRSYIRRIQHEYVEKNRLTSISVGDEPNRRLKVMPLSAD